MSGYTQDSIRLAVDAMISEWDEWALENQGTRECFEASMRAGMAQLQPPARSALVEALTLAREYVREHIASQRLHFGGFEGLSGIQTSEADLSRIDAALKAAGVVL